MTDRPTETLADRRAASVDCDGALGSRPIGLPTVAAVLAAAPVVAVALLRVARNAPGTLPSTVGEAYGVVTAAAWLGPALAALVLAATAVERTGRVGLAFVGAFGVVGGVAPAASPPTDRHVRRGDDAEGGPSQAEFEHADARQERDHADGCRDEEEHGDRGREECAGDHARG